MTRRIYTYPSSMGWGPLNLLSTVGACVLGCGIAVVLTNMLLALKRGACAGADPWGGATLEWATDSPPKPYGFARIPVVRSTHPLWEPVKPGHVIGLSETRREVLVTDLFDARPDHRFAVPGPSLAPFCLALATGVGFITLIFTPWGAPLGGACAAICLVAWFWPRGDRQGMLTEQP